MTRLVYVVDDEADVREVIAESLEARGFEVRAFADGAAALAAISERAPDLVLLDINMPGMSGWRVREVLRDAAATATIPVIAVTAQGGASVSASALQTLGFAGFLRKPFRVRELWGAIEKVLPLQEGAAAVE
jgi:CheY-like chemotaxis protein